MSDCLIIGGGIIGMMTARMLALSGAKVSLLEQRECGAESSWAGGGIISPLYPWHYSDFINDLSFASQRIYEKLCNDLHDASGINPQYQKSGLLMMDEYNTKKAKIWLKRYKVEYFLQQQGALFKNTAQVRNPKLLQALKADIIKKNVNVVEYVQADSLIINNNKVLGVNTASGKFYGNNVVLCSGAWTSQLIELEDKIFPMKGQMIVLKAKANTIKHIILDKGHYIIPRIDGRVLVGSTMEDVGFDRSIDDATKKYLYNFAITRFRQLADAKIEYHWYGFRPASRTKNVVIAKSEKYYNLFINAGHFRNGLNMAPASANKITKLIVG